MARDEQDPADEQAELQVANQLKGLLSRADPVPASVVAAAKASLAWRTVDAELAELISDSLMGAGPTLRGPTSPRLLSFETTDLNLDVEIHVTGGRARLIGQVAPPAAGRLAVESAAGSRTTVVDGTGAFSVAIDVPGRYRLRFEAAEPGPAVHSEWFAV